MTTHPEDALLDPAHARGLLLAASRDPDAKLTFLVTDEPLVPLAVKIPVSVGAGNAVDHERRMLVALAGMPLGELARTVPRCVGSPSTETGRALVSTALAGRPMTVGYHQWHHTARPAPVAADFRIAAEWLSAFQQVTGSGTARVTWAGDVAQTLTDRWRGDTCLGAAVSRLRAVDRVLGGAHAPVTAVHGDYWFGNVLAHEGRVSGVIDWENGSAAGQPLRDLARFALSYSLYLDRHTRPGRRVAGHPGLRRVGFAPGIRYALLDTGWLPTQVESFLRAGLGRLGLPPAWWYDVALVGIGEVAASANDDDFGRGHLELLAGMPERPR